MPRQHSTGGKQRLGATTKRGERSLRRLLIIGANSVIIKRQVHTSARPGTWLGGMPTRKPPMLVRGTLASKMARVRPCSCRGPVWCSHSRTNGVRGSLWALMARGGVYQAPAPAV